MIEEILVVNGPRFGMRSSDLDQHGDHYVPELVHHAAMALTRSASRGTLPNF
ncbi:hypothetical protein [Amycolatopsis thermoflava]|uniref:hypothetical protein n=1 Tax=Amycolatopsis thermoflava TaxID=84480 RepID=UPI001428C119|nr:hypothetical protein [Amycolatopsis thermoflava]